MNMSDLLTDTGLNLPATCTKEQFFEAGRLLARIEHGTQWAIGDWYNAIPWGDKEAACKKAGLVFPTASSNAQVSRAFQIHTRVQNLTFNHHKQLIANDISLEQRNQLIHLAEQGEINQKGVHKIWSSARLAKERDKLLGREPDQPSDKFESNVDAISDKVNSVMPTSTPKVVRNAVIREVKGLAHHMKSKFDKAVQTAVIKATQPQRDALLKLEKEAEEMRDSFLRNKASIVSLMTREEYRLVKGCLHPDRTNIDQAKLTKAFTIFSRLEDSIPKLSKKDAEQSGWN